MMDDYKIKLAAFEGPMDLLLHLIEKNKIDIIRRYKVLDLWGKKIIKGETNSVEQ